jgi:hypothetical protein
VLSELDKIAPLEQTAVNFNQGRCFVGLIFDAESLLHSIKFSIEFELAHVQHERGIGKCRYNGHCQHKDGQDGGEEYGQPELVLPRGPDRSRAVGLVVSGQPAVLRVPRRPTVNHAPSRPNDRLGPLL